MTKIDMKPAVVFVVAHPDDVAFGMGGVAHLLKDHYDLHVLCASKGERGYKWDGDGATPPSDELGQTRQAEERAACAMTGAKVTFLGQVDGEVFASQELCQCVADHLTAIKPKACFTLEPLGKSDHASACLAARQGLHIARRYWETEIYMTVRDSETHNAACANIFVDITDIWEHKKRQVLCHQSQLPKPDSWKRLLNRDRVMGKLAYCKYAEAFMTETALVNTRWDRKAGSILTDMPCATR